MIEAVTIIITSVLAVATILLADQYTQVKKKIKQMRELIVSVDDALHDDTVSEEEFREIYEKLAKLVRS